MNECRGQACDREFSDLVGANIADDGLFDDRW